MRKKFLLVSLFAALSMCGSAWAEVLINSDSFPDENFRSYIASTKFDEDENGTLSDAEIAKITELDLSPVDTKIESLAGIEYLTALTEIDCSHKNLKALDVSHNTLLEELVCNNNAIVSLDVSNASALTRLNCGYNKIETLDLTDNTALTNLYCQNNAIKALDLEANEALTYIVLNNNQLTTLDVTGKDALTNVICTSQKVTVNTLSQDTYGYKFDLSTIFADDLEISLVEDGFKAYNSGGNEIEFSPSSTTTTLYFDERPSTLKYDYRVGHEDVLMDVTVTLLMPGESTSTGTDTTTGGGGSSGGGGGCDSGLGFMSLILLSAAFRKRKH